MNTDTMKKITTISNAIRSLAYEVADIPGCHDLARRMMLQAFRLDLVQHALAMDDSDRVSTASISRTYH